MRYKIYIPLIALGISLIPAFSFAVVTSDSSSVTTAGAGVNIGLGNEKYSEPKYLVVSPLCEAASCDFYFSTSTPYTIIDFTYGSPGGDNVFFDCDANSYTELNNLTTAGIQNTFGGFSGQYTGEIHCDGTFHAQDYDGNSAYIAFEYVPYDTRKFGVGFSHNEILFVIMIVLVLLSIPFWRFILTGWKK